MDQKIVKVFISSTFEDLAEERESAKKAISELSQSCETLDFFLHPIDLKTGARPEPPKDVCLSEVKKSDILVGIIGPRYGSIDPETQKSISELEYDCAISMGIPCLYYICNKDIKREWIEGDSEREKLKNFRLQIDAKHTRDSFNTPEELRANILRDLMKELLEKFRENQVNREGAKETSETKIIEVQGAPEVGNTQGSQEIDRVFKNIKSGITQGKDIDEKQKERLFLFANSLYYKNSADGVIGNHEIHKFYLSKEDGSLYGFEKKHILKTLFSDTCNLKTGWYWLREIDAKAIKWYLEWLCQASGSNEQLGYFEKLLKYWPARMLSVATKIFNHADKDTKQKLLSLIANIGPNSCLKIISQIKTENDKELEIAQRSFQLKLMTRCSQNERLFVFIMSLNEDESEACRSEISRAISNFNDSQLEKIKEEHKNKKVRLLAVLELTKRNRLSKSEYRNNLDNENLEIRYYSYMNLIEEGETFDPKKIRDNWPKQEAATLLGSYFYSNQSHLKDKIIETIYERYDTEKLKSGISWIGADAPLAYKIYGLREYETVRDLIVSDLENNFSRIKEEFLNYIEPDITETLRAKLALQQIGSPDKTVSILAKYVRSEKEKHMEKKLEDFVIRQFKCSALKILYQKDIYRNGVYLKNEMKSDDYEIRELSKKLFIKSATITEIDDLHELTKDENSSIKCFAAQKALSFTTTNGSFGNFLRLKLNDIVLVRLCINHAVQNNILINKNIIFQLLYSKEEDIRKLTLGYLLKKKTNKKVFESILQRYTSSSSYFYNVVSWIDQIIYAPNVIKVAGRKELLGNLNTHEGSSPNTSYLL